MKWNLRKIWPYLTGICLLVWLYIAFYSAHGYEELWIPAGEEHFTATFSRISNIIPVNEDVTLESLVEEYASTVLVQFTDETDGTVQEVRLADCHLHTNGYTSVDNVSPEGLPLELVAGHTYTIAYQALCEDQILDHLSLALYGDQTSFLWLQLMIVVVAIVAAICLRQIGRSDGRKVPAMLLLWGSLYVLYLVSMPIQLREQEQSAYGRAYAVSNQMMGQEMTDEQGNVYVADQALRNTGYLSYDVPLDRFWSHLGATADPSIAATVTYRDDGVRTIRTYVDAAMITVARQLGLAYPLVYLSGSLLIGIIAFVLLGVILTRSRTQSGRIRVLVIAILPSVYSVLQLHSGIAGLFRPLASEYLWLYPDEILQRLILDVVPADGKALCITWIPLVILGLFLWNDVHKETMPPQREHALLTGMVVVSFVAALLRLQM